MLKKFVFKPVIGLQVKFNVPKKHRCGPVLLVEVSEKLDWQMCYYCLDRSSVALLCFINFWLNYEFGILIVFFSFYFEHIFKNYYF